MWVKEDIPDTDYVYIRVSNTFISSKDQKPKAAAFSNTPKDGDNLSCDWSGYCTPTESHELISLQKNFRTGLFKNHLNFSIWSMNTGNIREKVVPKQILSHDPLYNAEPIEGIPNNRAHSIIIGEKPENVAEFRVTMVQNGDWAIGPLV